MSPGHHNAGWPSTTGNLSGGGRDNAPPGGYGRGGSYDDDDDDDAPSSVCQFCFGSGFIWHNGSQQICPNC